MFSNLNIIIMYVMCSFKIRYTLQKATFYHLFCWFNIWRWCVEHFHLTLIDCCIHSKNKCHSQIWVSNVLAQPQNNTKTLYILKIPINRSIYRIYADNLESTYFEETFELITKTKCNTKSSNFFLKQSSMRFNMGIKR